MSCFAHTQRHIFSSVSPALGPLVGQRLSGYWQLWCREQHPFWPFQQPVERRRMGGCKATSCLCQNTSNHNTFEFNTMVLSFFLPCLSLGQSLVAKGMVCPGIDVGIVHFHILFCL